MTQENGHPNFVRILVVEDESKVAAFIVEGLREQAYAVDVAVDGEEGVYRALNTPYDVILLTNLLHHFNPDRCTDLLRRIRAALRPGGRLATIEFVPSEDRVTPPMSATFPLVMLATTAAGDAYTFSEYQRMLTAAGFNRNELHQLENSPQQLIVSQ